MSLQTSQTADVIRPRTSQWMLCVLLSLLALSACGTDEIGDPANNDPEHNDAARGDELATATGALDTREEETSADGDDEVLERIRASVAEHVASGDLPDIQVRRTSLSEVEATIVPTPAEVVADGECTYEPEPDDAPFEAREVPVYVPRVASRTRAHGRPLGRAALTEVELTETTWETFEPPPAALQSLIDDYRYRCLHAERSPDADCGAHPYLAEMERLQGEADQAILQERMHSTR